MKRLLIFSLLFVLYGLVSPAEAGSAVHTVYGETYYCGDSFEIVIPNEPVLTAMITRHPSGTKVVRASAGPNEILFEVRFQIRNLTPQVYHGLSTESFKLTGYVRGRPLSYVPEIMEPYDFGGRTSYRLYDKMYYKTNDFPPLRKADMLLVYRVNPILRDWEILVDPAGNEGVEIGLPDVTYPEMTLEPCQGIFQFQEIWNAETNSIIKY